MNRRLIGMLAIMVLGLAEKTGLSAAEVQAGTKLEAEGWITHPAVNTRERPIVLHFRREIEFGKVPAHFQVEVTADNRFILYVNGNRVASGPSTGNTSHWRETSLDLAPQLRLGHNVVSAVVWNAVRLPTPIPPDSSAADREALRGADLMGQTAPLFQQSTTTGFRLIGEGEANAYSTGRAGWKVKIDAGRNFGNGMSQGVLGWYVAGSPETIDGTKVVWDANAENLSSEGWYDAVAAIGAERPLIRDPLPLQTYSRVESGSVVRSDLVGARGFPKHAVVVPANCKVRLLIARDAMVSAYPVLAVSGGRGANIKVTYAEALYDANGHKGDRNLVGGRMAKGIHDTFLPDGNKRKFSPLWWRTWRYAELEITTAAEPLRLEQWQVFETGYPFKQIGRFVSSDPELNQIWNIGWRTARIDAHETYMDSAYWEQLQYVGDTRLQMLISYAVSGDERLAEQAIDAFAQSNVDGGLIEGAYPSRTNNIIATFSLLWVGMLDDWRMRQPDHALIVRNIPRMRQILDWFKPWLSPRGLLTKNPQWNFTDWVGQSAGDRTIFPSYSKRDQESCLTSVQYLGALRQGAAIESALGDPAIAGQDTALANRISAAILDNCWSTDRKLFSDNPDKLVFSQQMNALAVLYDVVPQSDGATLLDRIVVPGTGIDAPHGMYSSSYYFAWYLVRAFEHVGRSDRYLGLLKTWKDLLALNYTTWPEERGNTRSDTHAWSAHPTADLIGIVAGIQPAAPGYSGVRIKPSPGDLRWFDATAATPKGPVRIRYRSKATGVAIVIDCPPGLQGTFEWRGRSFRLNRRTSRFAF